MKEKKKMMIALVLIVLLGILIFAIIKSTSSGNSITVNFESHGGTEVEALKIKKGQTIEEPEQPVKEGYEFIGWYYDGKKFDFATELDKNIKLEAKWLKVGTIKNTVTFDSDGGSSVKEQKITKGEKVKKPANPTRSGYTFVEWTLDGKTYDFNSKVEKNIKLVAVWKENAVASSITVSTNATVARPVVKPVVKPVVTKKVYTVTFYIDEQRFTLVEVEEGKTVKAPADPTKENNIFKGWQIVGQDEFYNFDTPITQNIVISAIWKPILDKADIVAIDKLTAAGKDTKNQSAVTISKESNQITITKTAPLEQFPYETGVNPSYWVALSLDLGVRPTSVDVKSTIVVLEEDTPTQNDIVKLDKSFNTEDKTDFIVWVDVEAFKDAQMLVFKTGEEVIGSVEVVTHYQQLKLTSVKNTSNSGVEVSRNENALTVIELPDATSPYKLVFDLGINPEYIKVNGEVINTNDIISDSTAFTVEISKTDTEIEFTSMIDKEDSLVVTQEYIPVVTTEAYTEEERTIVVDPKASSYVKYDTTTKKFIVEATVTAFTFTDNGVEKRAIKEADGWKFIPASEQKKIEE